MDLAVGVDATALQPRFLDQAQQPSIFPLSGGIRLTIPGVVATRMNIRQAAKAAHRVGAFMVLDERVPHPDCLAKYTAVFLDVSLVGDFTELRLQAAEFASLGLLFLLLFIRLMITPDPSVKIALGETEVLGYLLHPPAPFGHLLDRLELEFVWITQTAHGTYSGPSV